MDDCLFCKIVAGELPATVVLETEGTLAFRDIAPVAPVHVVVITKEHHRDMGALTAADPGLAADLMGAACQVARVEDLAGGFRLVSNTGADGGQTVDHVHVHVLGGRSMTWPPG